ncbi:GATA type zinc finger transcription factor family protein [Striga asiatica]|uniref:GATA type zinc finger transcription factor family protein n=1 Tax=Striga asiatica TaxID=4170 RepID=A0A5A7QB07_STRAF|nr:GATA type zinc finger transcription factor family protein [Striga asiatica]
MYQPSPPPSNIRDQCPPPTATVTFTVHYCNSAVISARPHCPSRRNHCEFAASVGVVQGRRAERQVLVETKTLPSLPHSPAKLRRTTTERDKTDGAWWWKRCRLDL